MSQCSICFLTDRVNPGIATRWNLTRSRQYMPDEVALHVNSCRSETGFRNLCIKFKMLTLDRTI